jgi:hypothetical protein
MPNMEMSFWLATGAARKHRETTLLHFEVLPE